MLIYRKSCWTLAAMMSAALYWGGLVHGAGPLPVPCAGGACGAAGPAVWVTSGQASLTATGNSMVINQTSDRALLNWANFDVGAGNSVTFNQPATTSIALNRIFQGAPSQILGAVKANGQIYLINQNGFLFAPTATVNVGGLLASTLNMADSVLTDGLLAPAAATGDAVLTGGSGTGSITVQPGAQLSTNAAGERLMLAGAKVINGGSLSASDGQVILAAGDRVYLQASTDPNLRGLYVEVDSGGTVTNQVTGNVTAERGNISLVGLAVNQMGRLSATTSVAENGSIRLLARDTIKKIPPTSNGGPWTWAPTRGGTLELGPQSVTQVAVDATDLTTAVDEQPQPTSTVEMVGQSVTFDSGSQLLNHGGTLSVTAASNPSSQQVDSSAHIRVNSGALIDLSGNSATVPVTRNLVSVQLRANELANDPLQRNGALRGQTVVVDARVGTPLADVSGATALIGRTVLERTSQGGSALFNSRGDLVVAPSARVDVSGGSVTYTPGLMQTSQLIKADGSMVDVGSASPNDVYIGVYTPQFTQTYDRWGVIKSIPNSLITTFDQGYVQGANAGSVQFEASAMWLDGQFIGTAVNGAFQRTSTTQALGGQFTVGDPSASTGTGDFRAPTVQLVGQPVPESVGSGASIPSGSPLFLLANGLTQDGFTRLQIASNSAVVQPSTAPPLQIAPGGSLSVIAPRVEIDAGVTVPSGSVSLVSTPSVTTIGGAQTGVYVGSGVQLDVRGQWVNDSAIPLTSQPTGAALIAGGAITLSQGSPNGTLMLGSDVALRASGGAWLSQSGVATGGAGGAINIDATAGGDLPGQVLGVGAGISLDAFGVQSATGGSLSLQAPRLTIGDASTWLTPQTVSADSTTGGVLAVGDDLFSDFGFSKVTLSAHGARLASDAVGSILTVAPHSNVTLETRTLLLDTMSTAQPSASDVAAISQVVLMPAYLRHPMSVTLQSITPAASSYAAYTAWPGLVVGTGAQFTGDAGSTLQLLSRGNLTFDGAIAIPSGTVGMTIQAPSTTADRGYADRRLSIGPDASIDVGGGTLYQPSDAGLLLGQVLPGGSVALIANRGSVAVSAGSLIDIAGAAGWMDLPSSDSPSGYTRSVVASAAGTLQVQAEESIALSGGLQAQGGAGSAGADTGGALRVTLTRSIPTAFSTTYQSVGGRRLVEILANAAGSPLDGTALITPGLVNSSGIASLALSADDEIVFGSGTALSLPENLTLSAPTLSVLGAGASSASASYIALGPQQSLASLPVASGGPGTLSLQASQMDLVGSVAFDQTQQVNLTSSGDISLQGYGASSSAPGGSLAVVGNVTLSAARISPSTGSQYTISASGPLATVDFEQVGSYPGTPLSAGGSLVVNAPQIVQAGSVVAPFGSITLNASQTLQLRSGSLTSVSGGGTLIPYGRVDNGTSWIYGAGSTAATITGIPNRLLTLSGQSVSFASGATVDVSGGGDLYAWQWTPGTGGKIDVLASSATTQLYAITPALPGQAAPYDPMLWGDSGLSRGQSVYLSGVAGASGMFWLLPARYALLPGFQLLTAVKGAGVLTPGQSAPTADGGTIVPGYLTVDALTNPAATLTAFKVNPGSYAHQLAQYDDQLASVYFPAHAGDVTTRTVVPGDAGTLVVAVIKSMTALGHVLGGGASGDQNATVDLSAPSIEISAGGTGSIAGATELSSSTLGGWNAGRLLIGGTQNLSGAITVNANALTVDGDAVLTADEVLLTANQAINVAAGARLQTNSAVTGTTPPASRFQQSALNIVGNSSGTAAILGLSDLGYLIPTRSAARNPAGATINVAAGAQLRTGGAVIADAGGTITLADGSVAANRAYWSLGSTHVTFGTGTAGLSIDDSLLSTLQSAHAVQIASSGSIDLQHATLLGNSTSAGIDTLVMQATTLNNLAGSATSQFSAAQITLSGTGSASPAAVADAGGVSFGASSIAINGGLFGFSGFTTTTLSASGLIVGGTGGGIATSGDLALVAAALTASGGAATQILAPQGILTLQSGSAAMPASSSLPSGGTLTANARDILVDGGRVVAPAGVVSLMAANTLTLKGQSLIDVSGVNPIGAPSGSDGGSIALNSGAALTVASGAQLRVAGGVGANAGSLSVQSGGAADLLAALAGAGDTGMNGGQFSLTAASLADADTLLKALQSGQFTEQQSLRVGTGDLSVAAGATMNATHISLVADTGAVSVGGTLTAPSGPERSSIVIDAATGINVAATAVIDAGAIDPTTYRGGTIELATTAGAVQIAAAAQIRAQGSSQSGQLVLRAPAIAGDVRVTSLPSDLSHVDQVIIEPVLSSALTSATPSAADFASIATAAHSYMTTAAPAIATRLGLTSRSNVALQPFLDVTAAGILTLPTLDLSTASWRFAGEPGILSVRATGSITVTGTLSDGFLALDTGTGVSSLDLVNGPSTGLNIVAGAALNSASMSATLSSAAADLTLAAGAIVRSGTGNISLAAARDVVWGAGSSVYTGGVPGAPTLQNPDDGSVATYPDRGGSVRINAGRDVVGNTIVGAVSDWQPRGLNADGSATLGIDFSAFDWNMGALGGGDLVVQAGRDARDLSAAVADSLVAITAGKQLQFGGGNLSVTTGRDLLSAYLYVGKGIGVVRALGALGASGKRVSSGQSLGSLLVSGDASFDVSAVGNVQFLGELQATALAPTRGADAPVVFLRYGAGSTLAVQSAGGAISLTSGQTAPDGAYIGDTSLSFSDPSVFDIDPATVKLAAYGGDLTLTGSINTVPSSRGTLDLYASRDITSSRLGSVVMSDIPLNLVPGVLTPSEFADLGTNFGIYTSAVLHADDLAPVEIVAGRDVSSLTFKLPKAAQLSAGRDIIDVNFAVQNASAQSITSLSAGRDLMFTSAGSNLGITVGGPGELEVATGRNLDLGFSTGITTTGNLLNGNLPGVGADVVAQAGLETSASNPAAVAAFMSQIIAANATEQGEVIDYVAQLTGVQGSDFATATAAFEHLSVLQQEPLLTRLLFQELVASGREANATPSLGFTRGFAALAALYPGSTNGSSASSAANPYAGDALMPFSRIYTLDGGSISLLAPGGKVDVGLANPPTNTTVQRTPSQLGIVAQKTGDVDILSYGDVLVNESRVFTLGGGNIAIWSTAGNIDAGRGAKTSLSAPAPTIIVDSKGNVTEDLSSSASGSGIRTIITSPDTKPGDVDLMAPAGFVNAGDAGIGSSGNLNIAAQHVLGLDNIQVGGTATGVPPATSSLGVSSLSAAGAASAASNTSTSAASSETHAAESSAPLAQSALSYLEIFVMSLGEEDCRQDDIECLKRQKIGAQP
jgi:filamentous hemagglutinin family protein